MINKLILKLKRMSVRWKWAFILSSLFFVLYLVLSTFTLFFLREQYLENEKNFARSYTTSTVKTLMTYHDTFSADAMKNIFEGLTTEYVGGTPIALNSPLKEYALASEGIVIRVFNQDLQLIYENQPVPKFTFSKSDAQQLEIKQFNQQDAIVTTQAITDGQQTIKGYVQVIFYLNLFHQRMANVRETYFIVTGISVLLCTLFGNALAYWFFKPIKNMRDIMSSLKEDTLSNIRMPISMKRDDELTDLSISVNNLLDTLERYVEQQKQFVEDVSHELRTPVAIVEGHLKLLNRWGKDDPVVLSESLQASLAEIERMKTLVQEMLDLSRAEQVGIHYTNELTEVVGLIKQVHQNFMLIHPHFQFRLDQDYEQDDEQMWVSISRHHLEQVLIILLDNAVKYSTDTPIIQLSISKTINTVQLSIQDFGEGISEADLDKVFARFYRVDKARARYKGGNGLGLSIAKELIEGYKGAISVESVLGNGSTFRIQLPIVTDIAKIKQVQRKLKTENSLQEKGGQYER